MATRSSCPACGAPVDLARVDDEEVIPLEINPDASSDADRYRVVGYNPMRVVKVSPQAVGDFRSDHRFDCPGGNAGRR